MSEASTKSDLGRHPLPRLLCFLEKKQFTGVLTIVEAGTPRQVFVHNGIPVGLKPQAPDALPKLFMERGLLDAAQYGEALHRLAGGDEEPHAVLQQVAGLGPDEIQRGVRFLLFKDLCRLFQLRDEPFTLTANGGEQIQRLAAAGVAIEPMYLVYNGIRNAYDEARIRDDLTALRDRAVKVDPSKAEDLDRFGFGAEEQPVLGLLQQQHWLLDDLCQAAGEAPLPVLMVVYALFAADLLEVTESRAADLNAISVAPPTRFTPPRDDADAVVGTPIQKPLTMAQPSAKPMVGLDSQPQAAPPEPPPSTAPQRTKPRPANGPPSSGTFRKIAKRARVPTLILENARAEATKLKKAGNLGGEVMRLMNEMVDRLEKVGDQSPFQVLGVHIEAAPADIRKSYVELAKKFHPDRIAALGLESLREAMDTLFKRITEAHQMLADPQQRAELAAIFASGGRPEDAEQAGMIIAAELNFQKGEVFFRKGDLHQAMEYFQLAAEGNPDEGEHIAMLAWTQHQTTPPDQRRDRTGYTKEQLQKAIQLAPKCARAYFFLGKIHLAENNSDAALMAFQKAARYKSNFVDALREIRLIKMRREKDDGKQKRSTLLDMFGRKKKK